MINTVHLRVNGFFFKVMNLKVTELVSELTIGLLPLEITSTLVVD